MALTKAQIRTLVQEVIEDSSAKRWSAANLDLLIQITQDSLWSELLDFDAYFVSQLDTLTSLTSPGYVDVATGGDATKRFLRIQSIVRNGQEYTEVDRRDVVLEANTVKSHPRGVPYAYVKLGKQFHLLPYDTADDVEFRYSYYPTAFDSLADGTAVEWPEGHEAALVYETASRALSKGDTDDITQVAAIAAIEWQRLINAIRKSSHGPSTPFYTSTVDAWGGGG